MSVSADPRDAAARPVDGSGAMFDAIAARYDLINRLLTMGIDQRWRRKTVAALELRPRAQVLDLATGTADLALLIHRLHPEVRIVGLDPSAGMLEVGRRKVEAAGATDHIVLQQGDAQALPFENAQFDGVCIAFGIRNVPDRGLALREMARVTKRGGRVAILELSEPRGGLLGPLARFYIHQVVPRVGALLSGAKEYRYLEKSIAAFPPPDEFAGLMRRSGLEVLQVRPLMFGVCCLYVARPGEVL